jgi:uncharacterized membrane protein
MDAEVLVEAQPAKCEFSSLSTTSELSCLTNYFCQLLFGVLFAIPFLGVRISYAIISAFSSSDLYGLNLSSDPNLRKLNPITGQWYLFLVLGPVMEYIAVSLYLLASVVLAQKRRYY